MAVRPAGVLPIVMLLQDVATSAGGAGRDAIPINAGTITLLIAGISALATVILALWKSGQKDAKEARGERDALIKLVAEREKAHELALHGEVSRLRAEYEARIRDLLVEQGKELLAEAKRYAAELEREGNRASAEREKMAGASQAIAVMLGKLENHIEMARQNR